MNIPEDKVKHLIGGALISVALLLVLMISQRYGIWAGVVLGSLLSGIGIEAYQRWRRDGQATLADALASAGPGVVLAAVIWAAGFTGQAQAQSVAECLPIEAGGTGTHYATAAPAGGQVAVWKCGSTWRWVGTGSKTVRLDTKGQALADTLRRLHVEQGYVQGGYADLYPAAEALILGKTGKTNEVKA